MKEENIPLKDVEINHKHNIEYDIIKLEKKELLSLFYIVMHS
jgi:hypothetical protein